jgi:hypothetical protein
MHCRIQGSSQCFRGGAADPPVHRNVRLLLPGIYESGSFLWMKHVKVSHLQESGETSVSSLPCKNMNASGLLNGAPLYTRPLLAASLSDCK